MMISHANSDVLAKPSPEWSTFFAQEPDQDLEFDEGLEEDELNQHKPPTRRPLLWILILLIVVGVVYWTMKPDLAKLPDFASTSETLDSLSNSSSESKPSHSTAEKITIPTPRFREGEAVTLSLNSSEKSPSLTLTSDSTGLTPGPRITTGETLTIVDGEAVSSEWMYQVNTPSGQRGWIAEKHLRKKL